jgi:drug/metabolite transporter (DMT)-like permease
MDQEGVHRSAAEEVNPGAAEAGSRRARLALVLGIAAVSFSSILSFISGASPLAIAFYRNLLAGLILLPLAARSWSELKALSRREVLLLTLAGLFLSIHFGAWITSLFYTSITASVVLVHSDPLIVALLAFVFLGEKPSRRTILGFFVALGGVVLITAEGGALGAQTLGAGDLLALVGAACGAAYLVIGRRLRARLGLVAYVTPVYGVAALILLAWAAGRGEAFGPYALGDWAVFAALAAGPMLVGHTGFNYALRYVPAYTVNVGFLAEPVGATLIAWVLPAIAEAPSATDLGGGVIVLAGVALTMRGARPAGAGASPAEPPV